MSIPDTYSEPHTPTSAAMPVPGTEQNGTIEHTQEFSEINGAVTSPTPCELPQASSPSNTQSRAIWTGKVEFLLSAVGFAVGLGNIWRFPHLCYRHGGGAFLIPYLLMLAFMGLPLFYLELAFGQYASLGPLTIWRICPLFKGVGYAMFAISFLISVYYNVLIGYTLFYFLASFQSPLPWAHCNNWWNTAACSVDSRGGNATQNVMNTSSIIQTLSHNVSDKYNTVLRRSAAEEYWEYRVLGLTVDTDISNVGAIRWHVTLCLLLAWIIVFLCIIKGIKSYGKVVYFTATFPYIILFILFLRGVTLEGAGVGISFYLKPDFHKMRRIIVWKEAAVQILYSLGPGSGALLTMGSYNKFHNNCQKDAITVALINCGTSIFAGFVIFSVLGHMAHNAGVDVSEVAKEAGPGLAFVVYPEGLSLMPGAPFWSLCFFFMLFTLGLNSQFAVIECLITGIIDEFPRLYKYKIWVTSGSCILMFFLGLSCVTEGGMYVIDLFDKFATSFPLLFTVLFEVIIINWIYGFKRFRDDIEHMIGFRPNYFWISCWVGITPTVIMFILVFSCIQYDGITLENGYRYPGWAEAIGWLLSLTSLLMIPIWMVVRIVRCIGSCQNLIWMIRGPSEFGALHLKSLITPTHEWGPAKSENRVGRDAHIYGQMDEQDTETSPQPVPNVLYKGDTCIIGDNAVYGGDSYI